MPDEAANDGSALPGAALPESAVLVCLPAKSHGSCELSIDDVQLNAEGRIQWQTPFCRTQIGTGEVKPTLIRVGSMIVARLARIEFAVHPSWLPVLAEVNRVVEQVGQAAERGDREEALRLAGSLTDIVNQHQRAASSPTTSSKSTAPPTTTPSTAPSSSANAPTATSSPSSEKHSSTATAPRRRRRSGLPRNPQSGLLVFVTGSDQASYEVWIDHIGWDIDGLIAKRRPVWHLELGSGSRLTEAKASIGSVIIAWVMAMARQDSATEEALPPASEADQTLRDAARAYEDGDGHQAQVLLLRLADLLRGQDHFTGK